MYVVQLQNGNVLEHSAKGTTWKKHKYIKKVGSTYYYDEKQANKDLQEAKGQDYLNKAYGELMIEDQRAVDKLKKKIDKINNTQYYTGKQKEELIGPLQKEIDQIKGKNYTGTAQRESERAKTFVSTVNGGTEVNSLSKAIIVEGKKKIDQILKR